MLHAGEIALPPVSELLRNKNKREIIASLQTLKFIIIYFKPIVISIQLPRFQIGGNTVGRIISFITSRFLKHTIMNADDSIIIILEYYLLRQLKDLPKLVDNHSR